MAEPTSQQIFDILLAHDIDLLRVLDGVESEISAAVRALTLELVGTVAKGDPTEPIRAAFQQRRLNALIDEIRGTIRDDYRDMYRNLRSQLIDLGNSESGFFVSSVNDAIGKDLARGAVPAEKLRGLIDDRAITANANDADTMRGFFEREAAAHHKRAAGALRQGFQAGDNLSQLTARLKTLNGIQEREAVGIARTAYNHVTTNTRLEMMQRNAILFRGIIAVAVLDGNTSHICISRSNGMWNLNTGAPLPESKVRIPFPGPTPWHFGERTQLYPLTKTAEEIGEASERARRALNQLEPEQRALLNADPPAEEDYPTWLRRQPAAIQNQVLGPTRRKLWLNGELSLRELVTQKGRPLTLRELARRRKRAA